MKTIQNIATTGLLFTASCVFNTDIPLQNDSPECLNPLVLEDVVLYYPDSLLGTLEITDRSDTVFSLSVLSNEDSATDIDIGAHRAAPWPGSYTLISSGYDVKKVRLFYPSNRMGTCSGVLAFTDREKAQALVPFSVRKLFRDPFDTVLSSRFWAKYRENDTVIKFEDEKLHFTFEGDTASSSPVFSTGIRSVFRLSDSFQVSVDLRLRDPMVGNVFIGFFVSTSPDTGVWGGARAGIYISGSGKDLQLWCRAPNLQGFSVNRAWVAGTIGIERNGSKISYFLRTGDTVANPFVDQTYDFPADSQVYVHLTMKTDDVKKGDYCYWNNLTIFKGVLEF